MTKKILFVDDDIVVSRMGQLMLRSLGYDVTMAFGGLEALEILKNQTFDLIFLDLMMPDMYGIDVLDNIRNNLNLKEIPVILQTGANDKNEIDKAYALNIVSVMNKPYSKKDLIDHLKIAKSLEGYPH